MVGQFVGVGTPHLLNFTGGGIIEKCAAFDRAMRQGRGHHELKLNQVMAISQTSGNLIEVDLL